MSDLWETPIPYMLIVLWVVCQVMEAVQERWMQATIIAWGGIGVASFVACLILAYRAGTRR